MSLPARGNPRFAPAERRDLLRVVPLLLPRAWRGPEAPWEIQRGFRLRVVSPEVLVLTLGAPRDKAPGQALQAAPGTGEESFLVLPAPLGASAEALALARRLPAEEGWRPACLLVLSDRLQLASYGGARRDLRAGLRGADFAAAWILDEMPTVDFRGLPYFTVERSLRQLGRIGRRLARWAKYRRLLPF